MTGYRNLFRLRSYLRPHRLSVVAMFLCAGGAVGASTVIPLVISAVINGPIARHDRGAVVPLFLLALGLGVVECALLAGRRWVMTNAVLTIERDLRDDFYRKLQSLSVGFHDEWQTGQLLSRATGDLSTIRRFLGFGAIFLVVNVLQYLFVMALLLVTYAPLGVVVLLMTLPVIELARRFGRRYSVIARAMQDQQGDLATLAEEAATGIRVTKAFGRGPLLHRGYLREAEKLRGISLEMVRTTGRFWSLLEGIPNVTMAVVVGLGVLAVVHGHLSLGGLVAFTTLLVLLQWPIIDIGWILALAEESATAADRLYEVFDTEPVIADRPGAAPLVRPRGRLAFEHVGFSYDGRRLVLRDVSLVVEPGETVAIVGATGSGKTTMTALPPRLHDVTSGRVTLDGVDVRDITLTSLRSAIATAFEDPVLFSMSVRENLILGRPDATDDEIRDALELAQATFVDDLPWGLDTRIGEQGLSLSGGQRQRLALARAVVARPAVIVLDDPLSALDVHTEALVEAALARVLRDTTGLLVVHRPSTVALADRVALLEDGVLTAVGTHSELLEIPSYRSLLSPEAVTA